MVTDDGGKLLAQMRRGSIEYCVLALLASHDQYGFEITKVLTEADGLVTSEGTVYPLLTCLRNDGFVSDVLEGAPRRAHHAGTTSSYTGSWREALVAFRQQWTRFRELVDDILTRGDQ